MEKVEKFYQFKGAKVINTFGIRTLHQCENLDNWLDASDILNDFEIMTLNAALGRYNELGKSWNEEELKMHFISAIFAVANPNVPHICKTYFERPLEGIVDNKQMHLITDCMIASPKLAGDPDKPYFFMQEFKQAQLWGKTDPEGQMLAAMLLAQEMNDDGNPIYGSFVIERQWYFATLKGRNYCQSQTYNSTKVNDLHQIVFILRKLKALIVDRSRSMI
jgi:hypothetical protein